MKRLWWGFGVLALLAGCSVTPYPISDAPQVQYCLNLYQHLDKRILDAGAEDASTPRVSGFPYLRSSRFLASFADDIDEGFAYQAWLSLLNQRAVDALLIEANRLEALGGDSESRETELPSEIESELLRCGQQLVLALAKNKTLQGRVVKAVQVSPAYNYWQRIPGFYPLTALVFKSAVMRDQAATRKKIARFDSVSPGRDYRVYRLFERSGDSVSMAIVLRDLHTAPRNALGIPLLAQQDLDDLFNGFAPEIMLPEGEAYDRIGRVVASTKPLSMEKFSVDTSQPTVYRWIDYGRFADEVTVRLNYAFWFPQRPSESPLDLLAGQFDGLIWRVHLNVRGDVLAWDTVHQCGCWYRLYPAAGYRVDQGSALYREPAYIGQALSAVPAKRLYLESATHHIQAIVDNSPVVVGRLAKPSSQDNYVQAPYRDLKQLVGDNGKAFFSKNGMVRASARAERFLFWPMGVPSTGAMRVAGTHAIAFVGTRHFDDSFILEELGLKKTNRR